MFLELLDLRVLVVDDPGERSGKRKHHRREHDKKVCALGLLALLQVPTEAGGVYTASTPPQHPLNTPSTPPQHPHLTPLNTP